MEVDPESTELKKAEASYNIGWSFGCKAISRTDFEMALYKKLQSLYALYTMTKERKNQLDTPMRSESEVFSELTTLCRSEGYIHALAFISALNQYVIGSKPYRDTESNTENPTELTNTEIMVLVGLLIKGPIAFDLPPPEVISGYVD